MTATTEPGLRERKRLATKRAIQLAAVDLVAEHGLDGTTVEEIARRADVSPRTFFNYFSSKEAALIGEHPTTPEGEVVERFVNAGPDEPLMRGVARLIAEAFGPDGPDPELVARRKALMQDHPQLIAMRMVTMRRLEDELAIIIGRRMIADDPELADQPVLLERRARMAAYASFAVMRHAWNYWAVGESAARIAEHLDDSVADLQAVIG